MFYIKNAVSKDCTLDNILNNPIICLKLIPNNMAKNGKVGDGHRNGAVKGRSQVENPRTGLMTKRNDGNGRFMDVKTTGGKFKGVRTEK